MTEEEIHAWITFSTVPEMGLEDAVRLLGDFGSPGAVLDSSLSFGMRCPMSSPAVSRRGRRTNRLR